MRKFINTVVFIATFLFLSLALIFALNFFNNDIDVKTEPVSGLAPVSGDISILNWNIGYAGLGKDSDFYMDGGEMLKPPSRQAVETNLAGIQTVLKNYKSDFHIFQEISEPDMLNLGVEVLEGVKDQLVSYSMHYSSDFRTKLIPTRWALRHGLAVFSRVNASPVEIIRLSNEPTRLGGIVQRQYHIAATEFGHADGSDWILLNIHLSAFDEGGDIRLKQLNELIEIANDYYKFGKHVIVGGDWNIQLSDAEFPNTTKDEFLFWRTKLPQEQILPGWQIIVDETTPTMRSNERPYSKGENFTSIIDGYMISPNVDAISVKTIDTNFEFTDHQPILGVFRAKNLNRNSE
ncbi:MAG: hypothetical protein HKO02_02215 [Hyphomonadaceae bacterium]|nr:hypothetical protein [Hyphomonadaceae bacterium]